MADIHNKTTSSKSLDENYISNQKASSPVMNECTPPPSMPKGGVAEAECKPKLTQNLSDSYQIVKQRQQKYYYNELSKENIPEADSDGEDVIATATDGIWQEVCSVKNKLKRKKKLSASLTSVTDSVNQEKRTRIEGMQLNCRGKLQGLHEKGMVGPLTPITIINGNGAAAKAEKLTTKPPLPQAAKLTTTQVAGTAAAAAVNKVPPPRLKRKLQENVQTIQKLNALTEQLRLEINELKSSLTTERGAVRVLRAQNESETRKWKNEVKKLQNAIELLKKNNSNNNSTALLPNNAASKKLLELSAESLSINTAAGCLASYEIQRLTNEIIALKETHKHLDEKKMINCDADRRKAADMRTLRDSYEIRLTQLQKSAKTEISRLLEEIKTKERNIGQLKKDIQILQNKPSSSQNDVKSRNATTTNFNLNTTTTNKTINKPKKINTIPKKNINKANNELSASSQTATKKEEQQKQQKQQENKAATPMPSQVQQPNEMKKLKDIELINNTKNLQNNNNNVNVNNNNNNNNLKMTKILTTSTTNTTTNTQQALKLKMLENENNHKNLINDENFSNNLLKTTTPTTIICAQQQQQQQKEYHSLPHELTERLLAAAPITAGVETGTIIETKTHMQQQNDRHHEYRTKDNNNSDSDSALSSAPPSISPQPPPAGLETADIWQMIRTYTTDIEKMQKDIESLQKENDQLHTELSLAKEQIVDSEKIAMASNNNTKLKQLMERIKYLEEQEHQLEAEANELREQNELLEFRILELEENNDKWSLQSHVTPSSTTSSTTTSQTASVPTTKDVWACGGGAGGIGSNGSCKSNKDDPMQMLFGNSINMNMDSGITSPHSQHHIDDDLNLMDASNEELRRRINNMLKKPMLDDEDKQCLQQVLTLVQQLDLLSQRSSGPDSLNTTSCSSDDASSLDFVKSRISDYSSAASSSSSSASSPSSTARSTYENVHNTNNNSRSSSKSTAPNTNSSSSSARIVATVQPYNSSPQHSSNSNSSNSPHHQHHHHHHQQQHVPTNTPTDSPRKTRHSWQTSSLSESGVFVESDFLSDISENNVCTQTDFDDAKEYCCSEFQKLQRSKVPNTYPTSSASLSPRFSPASNSSSQEKRLQYYKERLEVLERKVLIYESSGDQQAKHLADRLQREIQLEKELKELRDRVEFLESENSTLEEEKCEFEEAENDTRLRLQRLEVELDILSQRNVELEMSREALSAKYKDCRSECLILRDDLSASETQIRHLEEDKQIAKENLEFLHNVLPLLLIYNSVLAADKLQHQSAELLALAPPEKQPNHNDDNTITMGNYICPAAERINNMMPLFSGNQFAERTPALSQFELDESPDYNNSNNACTCQYLKQEVSVLRNQIKDLNTRHYEALESADSHWVDIEREYKDREETYRAKEHCLKLKIGRLQDCLRDDARAANEKIQQLEECEKELKTCLLRITKEHRDLLQEHQNVLKECECYKEQFERMKEQLKPLHDCIDQEKKRSKTLNDELNFMRKLQQETESRSAAEMETLRTQLFDLKKEFLHIEVTNSELKEEVTTLECQLQALENKDKESVDKIRCLSDEVRTKEEMCQKLEKRLERSEGNSLAQELDGSPSKRFKREHVKDLKSASAGLGNALRNIKECDIKLPSHQHFQSVARDVKRLADTLLGGEPISEEEIMQQIEDVINEQLMNFHSRRMESEFYCTVYYPVKRQVPLDIKDFII